MRKKPDRAIIPVQSKMFEHGILIRDACKAAGISPASWSRWAAGGIPDTGKLRKLEETVDVLAARDA